MHSAFREDDPSFSSQDGAFSSSAHAAPSATTTSQDPFLLLPPKLTHCIISNLLSRDIATLRLSSRAFRQLPISLWYRLLRQEMPWFWEAWSSEPPSFWTTTSVPALKAFHSAEGEYQVQLQVHRDVIREEMPWMLKGWCDAEPTYSDFAALSNNAEAALLASRSIKLPRAKTNWYELYRDITAHWRREELKGLQNRQRIWKDVEEIISRIKRYRDEGKILD